MQFDHKTSAARLLESPSIKGSTALSKYYSPMVLFRHPSIWRWPSGKGMPELLNSSLNGADVHWMNLDHLIYWLHPEIFQQFIERGVDTQTGSPIASALKRSPRAFLGIYKTYIDRFPDWQFQADMALRHFCREGSMRGVCLLLWLKANPRAKVPSDSDEDQDLWEAGLWEACLHGHCARATHGGGRLPETAG